MVVDPKFYINIEIQEKKSEKIILNKNTDKMFRHSCESILRIFKIIFSLLKFNIVKNTLECLTIEIKDKDLLITFKIIRI